MDGLNEGKVGGLEVGEDRAGILDRGESGERERLTRLSKTQICFSFICEGGRGSGVSSTMHKLVDILRMYNNYSTHKEGVYL